ncbi:tryptophan-rich sensory protein [Jannaschia sp. Os4]|uniref:tryptophan-rich sensory protein n=1 Tax=Jannaschia sp. Os4 TaxID=2807617 RepID=UPI001939DEA8|nr:tryptophan-rich sensory protein [Jannaschia sp. Os4]MBM2577372.1 tryptophan-rich sensory protein [Jannaschia sp. Os4]
MTLRAALVLVLSVLFAASAFVWRFSGYEEGQLPVILADPPMQPAGWAFAIWGPIYVWLVASAAWGVWRRRDDPAWDATRAPLIVSLGAGVPWLAVASAPGQWAPLAATGLILVMLWGAVRATLAAPRTERLQLRGALGLYAGWLTAASAVSVGLLGAGYGLLLPPAGWALVVAGLATAVAVGVLLRRGVGTYAAAVAWALVAVGARNDWSGPGLAALACALVVMAVWGWARTRPQPS